MVFDNEEVAAQYGGVPSVPTSILIDRSGRIAREYPGQIPHDQQKANIESLLLEPFGETSERKESHD